MLIQHELSYYGDALARWATRTGIQPGFLCNPDRLVIEPANRKQFIKMQQKFALESLFMAVRQEKWRFFTIARKSAAYILPNLGEINWVEIAEPRDKPGRNPSAAGLKAVSFYVDDLSAIHTVLEARRQEPVAIGNEISVHIGGTEQSVIFTDVDTAFAVEEYVQSDEAWQVQLGTLR